MTIRKHDIGVNFLQQFIDLNRFADSLYHANPLNKEKLFMDLSNAEVRSFLKNLYLNEVKYMLVGGMATVFHGHVRTTQDLDLWIKDTPDNREKFVLALKQSHVPGAESFKTMEMVPGWSQITVGTKGFVADLMSYMKAFSKEDFDKVYRYAKSVEFNQVPITVIDLKNLIKEKKQLARPKDLEDVRHLEQILKNKKG